MPFCNTHVKGAVGHGTHHGVHRTTCWHGGSYAHNLVILFCQFKKRIAKYILKARRLSRACFLNAFAVFRVEKTRCVPNGGVLLCLLKTFTFHRVQVQQLGTLHILNLLEDAHQLNDVVSVCRTYVADVHTLKDVLLVRKQRLYGIVEAQDGASAVFIEPSPLCHLSRQLKAQAVVEVARLQLHQVVGHSPHGTVNTHIVVVEDDEHVVRRV